LSRRMGKRIKHREGYPVQVSIVSTIESYYTHIHRVPCAQGGSDPGAADLKTQGPIPGA